MLVQQDRCLALIFAARQTAKSHWCAGQAVADVFAKVQAPSAVMPVQFTHQAFTAHDIARGHGRAQVPPGHGAAPVGVVREGQDLHPHFALNGRGQFATAQGLVGITRHTLRGVDDPDVFDVHGVLRYRRDSKWCDMAA